MDGMSGPNFLPITEALLQIQDGTLSLETLAQACSRQIERFNSQLNAFITVISPPAVGKRKQGKSVQQSAQSLSGIPLAVKDLFETEGIRTTAGSLFFKDYIPNDDAVAVKKLKDAGALIMGKTNTHEIALGVTTVNPHFGICHNPWDTARIPGGSSGGSAVAVATGMALGALGTDTGGSIRIPASLCGVVGLKPTYGRVSVRGVFPLSWNLDHVGVLTRTARDAALLLQVIAGYDADDPYSINQPEDDYLTHLDEGVKGWRIASAIGPYVEESDQDVTAAVHEARKVFEQLGARVEQVDLSFLREAALANSLMTPADGAAYHRERLAQHPEWFGEDVRQRLLIGRGFTSTEYALARQTQTVMKYRLGKMLREFDLLILPSTVIPAPPIEGNDALEQARRLTRFTAPFNLTGLPAISIPCGFSQGGLPIGLQIISGAWKEASVLRAAQAYEKETDWSTRLPHIVDG